MATRKMERFLAVLMNRDTGRSIRYGGHHVGDEVVGEDSHRSVSRWRSSLAVESEYRPSGRAEVFARKPAPRRR